MKNESRNYVNNKELLVEFIKYREDLNKDPTMKIPDSIGSAIMMICNRLARRPNFKNYSYNDDMISDAIESCCKATKNFDAEKSSNPFAYLSQCAWYACVKRIVTEKKQSYIKHQMVEHDFVLSSYSTQPHDNDVQYMDQYQSQIQTNNAFDGESYERKLAKTRKVKQNVITLTPIEELMYE